MPLESPINQLDTTDTDQTTPHPPASAVVETDRTGFKSVDENQAAANDGTMGRLAAQSAITGEVEANIAAISQREAVQTLLKKLSA